MEIRAKILICDPTPESELALTGLLTANEHEVEAVHDGHEIIDRAKSLQYDLIIVASDTPGMDGFQVCRLLKESERTRHIPAMIVSSLTSQLIRNQAIEAGADEFIVKPLNRVELLARVVALLRIKELYDRLRRQIQERETETRKLAEKSRELSVLSEIARIVISTRDRRGVLTEIINNIRGAFNVDGCCLVTRKENQWILEIISSNLSSPFVGKSVGEKGGLYDHIAQSEKPLVIDDMRSHPLAAKSPAYQLGIAMTSTMASPIFIRGELIAVVQLFNKSNANPFSTADLPLLMTLSGQIGLAIENMQLFGKLSEFNMNLQKQIEEATQALLEMKNFNESIIQNVSSGILTIDFSGRILFANRASQSILETTVDEMEGKDLKDIFGAVAAEGLMKPTKGREGHPASAEIQMRTNLGREIYLGYTTTVRYDSDRRMLGYIISFRDITQIKELRATVMRMDRLAASGILTSAIAHEIRNPLAGIKTMAQALEKELGEGDSRQEYVERIVKQINRLNDLLKAFFTYAKPVRPEKRPCDLRHIMK
ncbi:MAG: response regulator, partial [Bacteroidetes bacterium]|nr:response regulator [Bacteroidota bacterium]